MQVIATEIPDVKVLLPKKFGEHRGFFSEVYSDKLLAGCGVDLRFVQDNHSLSSEKGVHVLLEAFACVRARFPDASCIVVGPYWGPIRKVRTPGEEPLAREIRLLAAMLSNSNHDAVFREHRVFDKRKPLLQKACRRLDSTQVPLLIDLAWRADQAIKGQRADNPWQLCERLVLILAGQPLALEEK